MRNHIVLWCVFVMLFLACRGEREAIEGKTATVSENAVADAPANLSGKTVDHVIPLIAPVAKRCEVGTQLDAHGAVAATSTAIRRDVPMYLTIWLSESPEHLQVSMRVRDSEGKELANVVKPAQGANVVTLKLDQRLDVGAYRVEGVWGGNVACEREVEITE